MSKTDEYVDVFFECELRLSREEIYKADGDFGRAAQNAIGHTGAIVERAQDEYDNYTLAQHDESADACD